ncbi:hypothetical protein EDD86DRAFT_247609 [Gorgonomyces haynaldii]|nr:hypothetical protein EDD86DRAFT_247609 [Gorgonomyces haynaldii]
MLLYVASVYQGLAIMEAFQCAKILVSKYLEDKKVKNTLIYRLGVIGFLLTVLYTVSISILLIMLIHDAPDDSDYWIPYYKVRTVSTLLCPVLFLITHLIIILRITAFYGRFGLQVIILYVLAVVDVLCCIGIWYFGYMTMQSEFFSTSPFYLPWLLCTAVSMLINILGTVFFISHLANGLSLDRNATIKKIFREHGGIRWFLLVGANLYVMAGVMYTFFVGGGATWVQAAYNVMPLTLFLSFYAFLNSSYVLTNACI